MNLEKNLDLAMNTFEREKLRIERHGLGSKQDLINALNGAIKAPDYFAKLSSEHFKNISIVHRCQQENPLFNHYVSQLCPLNSIEDFLVEYDNVLKYPKDPLVDKLDNLKHSVEANIKSYFKERDNYTRAKRKFPPIPNIETEEKTIDYKLEVRTKANKVVFSNLLELKDSTSHILEDIGEMNVLFQHHGIKDSDVTFITRAFDKLKILNSLTLDLRDNKITPVGFQELIKIFPNLQHIIHLKLYIGQNDLDDDTLKLLTSAMGDNLCYVRKLVLDLKLTNIYSKSGQKILDMVDSMKHLEEFLVFLNGTKMLKSTKGFLKSKLRENKKLKKVAVKL